MALKCVGCGAEEKLYMHHPDYAAPLVVEFLCMGCHMARHPRRWARAII